MSDWFDTYGFVVVDDGGLVTGGYPLEEEDVRRLVERTGVTRVLNLCEDREYEPGEREDVERAYARRGIVEERLGLVDFGDVLPGALERGVQTVVPWLQEGETVYVHCRAGWQRSATVAAAILAVQHGIEPDEALGRIQRRKPSAQPLHHQLEGLWRWWRARLARDEAPPEA
ncbi:dual specificity protein phosphatase family protein [Paraconexibacter sp.]|uniref:protein-tyrosine phosphatase family protein n=1 Tax=Paraconexibacter sp. TaxID=2949640 RepID=UPI003565C76E